MSYDNFVQVRLASVLAAAATTASLTAPTGANRLPPADGGRLILADSMGTPSFTEVISYTSRTGNILNGVVRGLEGTAAREWSAGSFCYQSLTAGEFQALQDSLAQKLSATGTAANASKLAGITPSNDALAYLRSSGALTFRNRIINGKMEIVQRGTSFTSLNAFNYTLDRWAYSAGGTTGRITIAQADDAPPTGEFSRSLVATVTTADATVDAADFAGILQVIEGYNSADLQLKPFTLSFWVRSSRTGVHCVALGVNGGGARSYVAEYTVETANVWEKKVITVPASPAGVTWESKNGAGLRLFFTLMLGANFQIAKNVWSSEGYKAGTANQVNLFSAVGNTFSLTGVQLEPGEVATPFEHRPYGDERSLCLRYYYVLQAGADSTSPVLTRYNSSSNVYAGTLVLPVAMRVVPTASWSIDIATPFHKPSVIFDAISNYAVSALNNQQAVVTVVPGSDHPWVYMGYMRQTTVGFSAEV